LTVASKFAFGDAALAIAQAGGMAGATGLEFEDFNAILGVTASNFSSGSDAGTSLKTFLTTLIPKSVEAADMMRDLGLFTGMTGKEFETAQGKINKLRERIEELDPTSKNYSDKVNKLNAEINELTKGLVAGGSAFFDANGNMKSAEEIAQALQNAFGGLSDARRNDALATIFGNDAMRTAAGLIDSGTAGIAKMKEEIEKVNAGDIAAKRMDTFAGAIEVAQGIIKTISISIGQQFLPVLRPLIEQFANLAQTHGPQLIDFFGKFAEKTALLIQQGFDWGQRVLPPLWEKLTQIGTALNTVTGIVMQALSPLTKIGGEFFKWQDVLIAVAALLAGAVLGAIGGFLVALAPVVLLVAKVSLAIAAMRKAWETNFLGIRDLTEDVLDRIGDWLQTYTSIWKGSWGKTLDYFTRNSREAWTKLSDDVVRQWRYWTNEVRHVVETWVDVTERKLNGWIVNAKNAFVSWTVDVMRAVASWKYDMEEKFGWFFTFWDKHVQPWVDKGVSLIQGLWDGMKQKWNSLRDWFTGVWGDLTDRFKSFFGIHSPSTLFRTYGDDMMAGLREGIDAGSGQVFDSMDAMNHGIAGKLAEIDGLIDMSQSAMAQKAWDAQLKFLEEASKPVLPYWMQPDYKGPASTMPPVLADPNSGSANFNEGPVKPALIPVDHLAQWFNKTVESAIGFKFSGNTNILDSMKQAMTKLLDDAVNANLPASHIQQVIAHLNMGNMGDMTVGQLTGSLQNLVEEARYLDQLDGSRDPQMERNNELLTILINELRNKNMSANFNVISGGSYSDLVSHVAGMKT
jgi:hypothetical protein